jgi:hypothetical protein
MPTPLLFKRSAMAAGSSFASAIDDHFGFYGAAFGTAAFGTAIVFNAANLAVLGTLALRRKRLWGRIRRRSQ